MTQHARAVVIGGGVIGCAVLNYLTKAGWTDVVLLEKNELTAGATWHAAANTLLADDSPALNRINILSQRLYRELEAETGESVGFHKAGCLRMARDETMLERLRGKQRVAHHTGVRYEILGRDETHARDPLLDMDKYIGASWAPDEGYMDPSLATHAFARTARGRGAKIHRQTKVTSLERSSPTEWRVETPDETWLTENVILCSGMWANELTRPLGIDLPMLTIERQYLLMEDLPDEYQGLGFEIPLTHDFAAPFYCRQLGRGLVVGVHDQHTVYCFENGIPPEFGQELFPIDLDRVAQSLGEAVSSVPVLERIGMRSEVCGPTSRTPDLNGLLGALPGHRGLFVSCAWASGITQGAGIGALTAELVIEGETSLDIAPIDVNRFGGYATRPYVRSILEKGHNFGTADSNTASERASGRPARLTPLYPAAQAEGAHFGVQLGWEVPLWYDSSGTSPSECVRAEASHIATGTGVVDIGASVVLEIVGPEAEAALTRIFGSAPATGACLDLPSGTALRVEEVGLLARLADNEFWIVASPASERRLWAWLSNRVSGACAVNNLTGRISGVRVVGSAAAEALAAVAEVVPDGAGACARVSVAFGAATMLRHRIATLDAIDVHLPAEACLAFHQRLRNAAPALRSIGHRALDSLRLSTRSEAAAGTFLPGAPPEGVAGDYLYANGAPWGLAVEVLPDPRGVGQLARIELSEGARAETSDLEWRLSDGSPRRVASVP